MKARFQWQNAESQRAVIGKFVVSSEIHEVCSFLKVEMTTGDHNEHNSDNINCKNSVQSYCARFLVGLFK